MSAEFDFGVVFVCSCLISVGCIDTAVRMHQQRATGSCGSVTTGPPSFRLQQQSLLMRAQRHVHSLPLECVDEDCVSRRNLQAKQKVQGGYTRFAAGNVVGSVDGDQYLCGGLGYQQCDANQRPQQAVYYCIPAGGDQSCQQQQQQQVAGNRCQEPSAPATLNLTATETSAEVQRHKPCPLRRGPNNLASGSSEKSMHVVTDSLKTSTSSASSVPHGCCVKLASADDNKELEDQPTTCSDAFTDDSRSESPLPQLRQHQHQKHKQQLHQQQHTQQQHQQRHQKHRKQHHQQKPLTSDSRVTVAIHVLNSTGAERREPSVKSSATEAVHQGVVRDATQLQRSSRDAFSFPTQGRCQLLSTSAALSNTAAVVNSNLLDFRLPASTWAATTGTATKTPVSAVTAEKSQLAVQQPQPVTKPGTFPSVAEKQPQRQQHQQLFKQFPLPPSRCRSFHRPQKPNVAHEHRVSQTSQATSTATSTATFATETPGAVCNQTDSASQQQAELAAASRRLYRHQHQHYQQLPRRRPQRRRELHRACAYLPSDSFSAAALGSAPTAAIYEDQSMCQSSAVVPVLHPMIKQLQRPLISRSVPQPALLTALAAARDAQRLFDRVEALHTEQVYVIAAAQILVSGGACDVVLRFSCYRCCLTLVSGSGLYQRVAPQLPPQPTLRRNLHQKATVSVHQRQKKTAKQLLHQSEDSASDLPMLLHHHRSDCHLLERLSVTARLLGTAWRRQDEDSAPSTSALMSRVFYPEELTVLLASPASDFPACDGRRSDAVSCCCGGDNDVPIARSRGIPASSVKSAAWSVVTSLATLRARVASACSGVVCSAQSSASIRMVVVECQDEEYFSDSHTSYDGCEFDDVYQETDDIRETDVAPSDYSSSSGF